MTREHKLALILGFAVLMVVGVLVGDHFSRARTGKAQPDLALNRPDPSAGTPDQPPVPELPPERTVAQRPPAGPEAGPGAPPSRGNEPPGLVMGSRDTAGGEVPGFKPAESPFSPPAAKEDTTPSPFPPAGGQPLQPTGPGSPTVVAPPVTPPAGAGLPISKGVEKMHPVKENETLFSIAKKYYGDSGLWQKLAEYNKGRVRANGAVREGVTIRIPPKDVLLGQATLASTGFSGGPAPTGPQAAPPGESPKPQPPAAGGGAARTYTVKKGDTLGTISQSQLGTSRRWQEIMSLNRDQIDDESSLKVGMVLKLPAR
ncbi:MAG: LysM peptidoglycan-binding domain-containing protein [Phycisphaerae bacterium]|nr:LysM peptidoglycan-binding domain-containing protein [Phycisphaerae bacterium]